MTTCLVREPSSLAASQPGRGPALEGLRVLLVEDEAMVAMMIEDMLCDLGCQVIGPVSRVASALDLLEDEPVDAAVLDVNLGGEAVFPVADRLAAAGVPFVFSTGYGLAGLDPRHADRPVLQKPYSRERLGAALAGALGA
jgi:CheY-like chemotaxis protein